MQKTSIAIFVIAFLSVNCSFLRNLGEIKITQNTGKFTPSTTSCLNKNVNYTITISDAEALDKIVAKLNDSNTIALTCQSIKAGDTKISCTGPDTGISTPDYYKVGSIEKGSPSSSTATLGTFADNAVVKVLAAPKLGTVVASQSVDASKNEAFKILFAEGATFSPLIFIKKGDATTVLPDGTCTFTASSHEAACTLKPGNGIVKDGDEFNVFYDKDCTVTDTGITVKYSSSNFAKVGALIFAIALLF